MERWQNIDFKNPTKEVLFDLCMVNIGDWEIDERILNGINREDFRDLLVKYKLQSYTDLLIYFQLRWLDWDEKLNHNERKKDDNDLHLYKLKTARILKMLLLQGAKRNKKLDISFTDSTDKIDTDGVNLLKPLQEVFKNEFQRLGLNISFGESEFLNLPNKKNENLEKENDQIQDKYTYAITPYTYHKISSEFVNNVVTDLETSLKEKKGKAGAKIKNMSKGELAKRLSYLHRIDLFLNQNQCTSIKEFPLSNKTCRFIYEYFEFWDILSDTLMHDKNDESKKANYVKALIRNNASFSKRGIFKIGNGVNVIDPNLDLKIDLFKKVKDRL